MKKGRPGMILHVLCSQEAVNNMLTVIFYVRRSHSSGTVSTITRTVNNTMTVIFPERTSCSDGTVPIREVLLVD